MKLPPQPESKSRVRAGLRFPPSPDYFLLTMKTPALQISKQIHCCSRSTTDIEWLISLKEAPFEFCICTISVVVSGSTHMGFEACHRIRPQRLPRAGPRAQGPHPICSGEQQPLSMPRAEGEPRLPLRPFFAASESGLFCSCQLPQSSSAPPTPP